MQKGTGNDEQRKTREIERFARIEILVYLLPDQNFHTGKRSVPRVFSLFLIPSPFLYIARKKAVLIELLRIMASVTAFKSEEKVKF